MRKRHKHLDFEINLIPCIDLLSTCICFLLLTAVWLHVGSMNVKQAVGGQPAADTEKKPVVWVHMQARGDLSLDVQDSPTKLSEKLRRAKIAGRDGKLNLEDLAVVIQEMRRSAPQLVTALIQPQAQSSYEDIIDLMDQFKKEGMVDLGVAPL